MIVIEERAHGDLRIANGKMPKYPIMAGIELQDGFDRDGNPEPKEPPQETLAARRIQKQLRRNQERHAISQPQQRCIQSCPAVERRSGPDLPET